MIVPICVHVGGGLSSSQFTMYFRTRGEAQVAHDQIIGAARVYQEQRNFTERQITIETFNGPATLSVSDVLAVYMQDISGVEAEMAEYSRAVKHCQGDDPFASAAQLQNKGEK